VQVKECFVIEFDQDAYMAAAQGPAAARDFFNSRMVLGEGARVRCTDPELGQQVGGREEGRAVLCCAVLSGMVPPSARSCHPCLLRSKGSTP
jgi:hypothetical protein